MRKQILIVSFLCILAISAQAASKEWLHVHVDDSKGKGEKVRVNIPLSLMEVMLPLVEDKAVADGKIHLNNKEFKTEDLRKVWKAVKDEGDAEYVSVEGKDQNVKVYTKGNFLMVQTDDASKSNVNIKIPLAVVDAMLSGSGDELNLMAAVKALRDSGVRDIIQVQDEDTTVNVWIDDRNVASR